MSVAISLNAVKIARLCMKRKLGKKLNMKRLFKKLHLKRKLVMRKLEKKMSR